MEGIPLRTARRGDIPSLLLLWTAMMQENAKADARLGLHPSAREHMAAQFANWIGDPERAVIVAEESNRLVVGYAAGRIGPGTGWHHPLRVGEITDCFVVPPRRRHGIGRRLAGRLCDMLYEMDVDTVRLQVAVQNEMACAFWESLGWQLLETVLARHGADAPLPPAP